VPTYIAFKVAVAMIRSVLQQSLDGLSIAIANGIVQHRVALLRFDGIDVGSLVDHESKHVEMSVRCSVVQRRAIDRVPRIGFAHILEQQLQLVVAAIETTPVQRRVAVVVDRVRIGATRQYSSKTLAATIASGNVNCSFTGTIATFQV